VDSNGNALTFNGSTWSAPTSIDGGRRLTSVSCPSSSFCAAVDSNGNALTFNGSSWSAPTSIDGGGGLGSVSCPSSSFCAAVDNNFGNGKAATFNGSTWSKPSRVESAGYLASVSCASASFCVAVDSNGNALNYGAVPTVTSLVSNDGPTAGGNTVTITGTNMRSGATVRFAYRTSSTVTFVSPTQLKAVAPAGAAGSVNVTVTTPVGTSPTSPKDLYAYGPPTISSLSPMSGITGSTVTISGSGLVPGMTVRFGSLTSQVMISSGTQINAVVPNGAGPASISATDAQGTATSKSQFTPTLSITGFSPTSGAAGTAVTINRIGFKSSSIVKFNGVATSSMTFVSSKELQAIVPSAATTGAITVTNSLAPKGTVKSSTTFNVT
jgi:hypothetical protein